ncbi:MAG: 50S ribosomal protein L18 [Deltaproteobacteria bacterium]|nr:50S ribosomal protein L18 [Deltaproteobacteria bacterium]MBW2138216.1 50S ribosomal protein L18 [Deltaproteobacteria bacterium]
MISKSRTKARLTRKKRVRKKVKGSPERPRLSVYKSARHIYAQIIDDETARTLVDASSLSKDIREKIKDRGRNREGAQIVGESIAKRALEKGIKKVVFDRNGFLYHGRVKVLAEAARGHGLEF